MENVESDSGTVKVAVCDKGLSREGCPYSHAIPAAKGFVETEFDDIPPGTYAVVGYHDVNNNNQFDKLFGMPREPYALSSRAGGYAGSDLRRRGAPYRRRPELRSSSA